HQHAALLAVAGHEMPHDMPCFRDPENLIYGKAEAGGMVLGGYELNPAARWIDGVPWDHAGASLPPDQARFEPLLAGAARRFPFDSDEWGRPRRLSALHTRMQDLGAVFGTKHGWERPDFFQPGRPWRRAGADQRAFGFTRPPFFDRLAEEHRAFRERVGIIDMSPFGKIELSGPDALPHLERVAGNLIDRPVGSVVYTQLLEKNGGIVADVTS